jgi:DNA-directed RNA polymerase specialized sigma24 family protein
MGPVRPLLELDADALRRDYVAAVDDFERAARSVRAALDEALATVPVLRSHFAGGGMASGVPSTVPDAFEPKPMRTELSEALDALERARHATQRAFFSLLVTEGMSMAEIGRMVGISRSLVSRIVRSRD